MLRLQEVAFIVIAMAAIGVTLVMVRIKSQFWRRVSADSAVRVYARLFGVIVGVWLLGTVIYYVAPGFIAKLLVSATQFQTIMLTMLVVSLVILVTMSIRATR